jgi:aconitate hydratase
LAESFERIHRSNLVGMGVLPLQFIEGENASTLNLEGTEDFSIKGLEGEIGPGQEVIIIATGHSSKIEFRSIVRLDSSIEVEYYNNGGILPTVLQNLMQEVQ